MELTYFGVWLAGVVSFFSPCIIPLIPMYVGFLAGDMEEGPSQSWRLYLNALGFFIGLMSVFIALGAVATSVGGFLLVQSTWLRQVSGLIIMGLGVFQLGLIKPNFLLKERKFKFKYKKARFGTAVVMGMAFSFGWTPCVGPILASVLLYAASTATVSTGIVLLVMYTLGFMVPFVVTTLLMGRIVKWLETHGHVLKYVKIVSGLLMITVGILIFTNDLNNITTFFL